MKRWLALLLGLLPAACTVPPTPHPHYVLGAAYQAEGVWHYPRRRLDLRATGLAGVVPAGHGPLTANGEAFAQDALAAASPDLQLPAIARLTNLANGRRIDVRINDRGPADPARLVAVTRLVARLLGFPASGVAPVRLHVLAGPSRTAAAALPGAPRRAMVAAPVGAVVATELGAPGRAPAGPTPITLATLAPASGAGAAGAPASGARVSGARAVGAGASGAPASGAGAAGIPDPPMAGAARPGARIVPALSGQVTQGTSGPETLWVRLNRFTDYQYAAMLAARLVGLHPVIRREMADGAEHFAVRLGPFAPGPAGEAAAGAALRRAIGAGVGAARIVVEQE